DIQEMIALFVLVHFYITPIFYSADLIGRDYKDFYFMNPMACFVELYRFCFLGKTDLTYEHMAYAVISSIVFFLAGKAFLLKYYFRGVDRI
ncbi:hypothetical protein KAJ27_19820, partial [bacterium]|nr:hypothetical protein [bacterium]